ncbi:hypothetical protein B0H13DRAFT_1857557 [Mycena leptocephala]|nr:hypothetical protein B0H13DRAFT_1857557 [Mycena leptocephala]
MPLVVPLFAWGCVTRKSCATRRGELRDLMWCTGCAGCVVSRGPQRARMEYVSKQIFGEQIAADKTKYNSMGNHESRTCAVHQASPKADVPILRTGVVYGSPVLLEGRFSGLGLPAIIPSISHGGQPAKSLNTVGRGLGLLEHVWGGARLRARAPPPSPLPAAMPTVSGGMRSRTSRHCAPDGAPLPPDARRDVGEGTLKILKKFRINQNKYKDAGARRHAPPAQCPTRCRRGMRAHTLRHCAPDGASLPPNARRDVGEGAPKIFKKITINPNKYKDAGAPLPPNA